LPIFALGVPSVLGVSVARITLQIARPISRGGVDLEIDRGTN
jgi:hypothetical protein